MGNGKIFISYRREDTSGESGRLKDKLEQIFGQDNIFYDVETLEAGLNFDQSIAKALSESKVLLAMIGPHWLKVEDSKGVKRIQKPDDWVRKEISEALKRGLRVIPVLVNGAEMPDPEELPEELKELSLKHAQELTSSRWNYDVGELTKVLEKIIVKKPEPKPQQNPESHPNPRHFAAPIPQPKSWWAKYYLWILGGVVVFVGIIAMCDTGESFESDPTYEAGSEILEQPTESAPVESGTLIVPESESTESQATDEFIPDLRGEWILYLNGEKTSIFAFDQTGFEVAYYEYDVSNQRTGEGSGQINSSGLTLDYSSTTNDVKGIFSLSSFNSGQSWEGTIYFPKTGLSFPVQLARN